MGSMKPIWELDWRVRGIPEYRSWIGSIWEFCCREDIKVEWRSSWRWVREGEKRVSFMDEAVRGGLRGDEKVKVK